jgi:hypothetical protein
MRWAFASSFSCRIRKSWCRAVTIQASSPEAFSSLNRYVAKQSLIRWMELPVADTNGLVIISR